MDYGLFIGLTLFLIFLLIVLLRKILFKKRIKLVENGKFVTSFFEKYPHLRNEEYLPNKGKSINNKHDDIFFATSFLIFVDSTSIRKIDYKDIYWSYGEVFANKGKNKFKSLTDILVIKAINGTYRHPVKSQETYVRYLSTLSIPAGFSENVKKEALKLKNEIKLNKKKK